MHDIRQPLSTIETSVVILSHLLDDTSGPGREFLRVIERQVEQAARTLDQAAAALSRLRPQPAEAVFEKVEAGAAH